MSDQTNCERALRNLDNASRLDEVIPPEAYYLASAVTYALLDIADAIREHAASRTPIVTEAQLDAAVMRYVTTPKATP